jgi:hypothetical protein
MIRCVCSIGYPCIQSIYSLHCTSLLCTSLDRLTYIALLQSHNMVGDLLSSDDESHVDVDAEEGVLGADSASSDYESDDSVQLQVPAGQGEVEAAAPPASMPASFVSAFRPIAVSSRSSDTPIYSAIPMPITSQQSHHPVVEAPAAVNANAIASPLQYRLFPPVLLAAQAPAPAPAHHPHQDDVVGVSMISLSELLFTCVHCIAIHCTALYW